MSVVDGEDLATRLEAVRARVTDAAEHSGRDPATVLLLAVTKGHPAAVIEAAVALGLADIGESRVQEAGAKHQALPGLSCRWHMIGHLQRNKARAAAALFDAIHSVDSAVLASALDRHRPDTGGPLRVLLEVELTGLPGRSGVTPEGLGDLVRACSDLPRLDVRGLMTVAPPGPLDAARRCFAHLRELAERTRKSQGVALPELSMGMSEDFDAAIAEGSTIIRLGRVLFGDRPGAGGGR